MTPDLARNVKDGVQYAMRGSVRSNQRKHSGRALLAVIILAVPTGTGAAPLPPPQPVARVAAAAAVTPPTNALVTPWPLAKPCARPRWLGIAGRREGTLFWSNASGSRQASFGQESPNDALPLPADLPPELFNRLWVSSGPMPEAIYVDCKPSDDGSDEHAIEWSAIPQREKAEVTARYTIPRMPRGRRLARWLEPPKSLALFPETDKPAPFLAQIGWGRGKAEDVSKPSIRFTRDFLADLRDLVALGCSNRRCASVLQSISGTILQATTDPNPTYERLDQETGQVEPLGHKYEWRMSTRAMQVRVGCLDFGADAHQLLCELTLTTSRREVIQFDAFHAEIKLVEPKGFIGFAEIEGGRARVTISGAALALRDESNITNAK